MVHSHLKAQSFILNPYFLVKFSKLLLTVLKQSILCMLKTSVFIHSPSSVNGKQTHWFGPSPKHSQPINTLLQEHTREG